MLSFNHVSLSVLDHFTSFVYVFLYLSHYIWVLFFCMLVILAVTPSIKGHVVAIPLLTGMLQHWADIIWVLQRY